MEPTSMGTFCAEEPRRYDTENIPITTIIDGKIYEGSIKILRIYFLMFSKIENVTLELTSKKE